MPPSPPRSRDRATASRFITARREEQALEVLASLPGDGHLVVGADLLDANAVRRAVDEVAEAFGGIDVLVNNAGIFEPHPITDTSYFEWQESWRRTLGVNLIGAANVTWCVIQHMGAAGGSSTSPREGHSAASPISPATAPARPA